MAQEKKTYKLPVTWEMCGVVEVEASSMEEAEEIAYSDETSLPTDGIYVDGSFSVNSDIVLEYNTPTRIQIEGLTSNSCWYVDRVNEEFDIVRVSQDRIEFIVLDNNEEKAVLIQDCKIMDIK